MNKGHVDFIKARPYQGLEYGWKITQYLVG